MSITSLNFMLFALALCLLYFLLPHRFQWIILLLSSLIFYLCAGWKSIIYILITAAGIYFAALRISALSAENKAYVHEHKQELSREEKSLLKRHCKKHQQRILTLTLVLNFGILCVFKYLHFAIDQINALLSAFGTGHTLYNGFSLLMPLGISFYTFQSTGYLVDVYWEKCEAQHNFGRMLLFVSFFPQIIQGPISSYSQLSQDLFGEHDFSYDRLFAGLQRMLWGFFKKLVLADMLSPYVHSVFADYGSYAGLAVLIGAFFYSIQIYADFSGYMDIVCGLCHILGIRLTENFDRPYFSKSVAEYWRRWHISLGDWFKTYLYYPIAVSPWAQKLGKRCQRRFPMWGKTVPATLALILVWFTTGLWHGASWAYIAWGGVNGFFIIIALWLKPVTDKIGAQLGLDDGKRWWLYFKIFCTFILITIIKVLPEVGTLSQGIGLWKQVLCSHTIPATWDEWFPYGADIWHILVIAFGTGLMLAADIIKCKQPLAEFMSEKPVLLRFSFYFVLICLILVCGNYGSGYNAQDFMYFKF